jgi:hypothetical protein
MKCFLSQSAGLLADSESDRFSKYVQVFGNYIRAEQRKAISFMVVSESDAKSMGIEEVSIKRSVLNKLCV